jgi:hypothetical protein
MPSELRDEELLLALRLEPLDPDDALMPPRPPEFDELEEPEDEPLVEALSPPWPERSCELPRPELVLPDAPRPLLRSLLDPLLLSPLVLLLLLLPVLPLEAP